MATPEDSTVAAIDVKDFVGTLKQLSEQAVRWEGTPEVQNGARLEGTVIDISKQVDSLRSQMSEVTSSMKAIECQLAELKEPACWAESVDALVTDAGGVTRPEPFTNILKERLLKGSWRLTWERVNNMNGKREPLQDKTENKANAVATPTEASLDMVLGILGLKTVGILSKKRQRLRKALNLSRLDFGVDLTGVEEAAADVVEG
ncbi:hypothetical protein O9K51_10426 [Purpureocillium lavendulum]|uniref:Uncharacterized protein n=1 Tax=Purpureocillium lavendulum TaxID=1247861 RepID=A0AB34FEX0_9HYPO|nr:hypothetical protein O9K51_10426 [Purpureocillium lavendulum]